MFFLLLLIIGSKPNTIYCDKVIYEHYYTVVNGVTTFGYDELIFYEQDPISKIFIVQNWVLLDEKSDYKTKSIIYIHSRVGGYDVFNIYDSGKGRYIIIKTKIYEEVVTVGERDLERQNKDILGDNKRRSLW